MGLRYVCSNIKIHEIMKRSISPLPTEKRPLMVAHALSMSPYLKIKSKLEPVKVALEIGN